MDRQHRKELKHDKFVDELCTLSARAKDNQRLLLTITAAALALALIGYGIYFYRSNREQQAQVALGKAIDTIQSPLLPAAGGQAMPGAKYKTDQERTAAAETQFREVTTKYSGSDAADVADLYLARIDAMKGNTASAQTKLQKFVDDHPKSILVGAARFSLYQLRIENGQATQVVSELQQQIAKPAGDSILPADTMLVLLAHAYDAQGNADKSKDAYRRIVTEFPDSPYAVEAQRKAGPA